MNFDFTDALILESAYIPGKPGIGVGLKSLILYADYVNHAILTLDEINTSFAKLSAAGLISVREGEVFATPAYAKWKTKKYGSKKPPGPLQRVEDTQTFLNAVFGKVEQGQAVLPLIEETVYRHALNSYLTK
jgi:hypothetical protein